MVHPHNLLCSHYEPLFWLMMHIYQRSKESQCMYITYSTGSEMLCYMHFVSSVNEIYAQCVYLIKISLTDNTQCICNSYTMARRNLPDIYACSPWARAYVSGKSRLANGISNIYHLGVRTKTCIGPFGSLYKRPSEF